MAMWLSVQYVQVIFSIKNGQWKTPLFPITTHTYNRISTMCLGLTGYVTLKYKKVSHKSCTKQHSV